jgi:hypothetical protein
VVAARWRGIRARASSGSIPRSRLHGADFTFADLIALSGMNLA